ncbi:MAG: hypothetical protein ACJATI_003838 [Halioglobus sp.]|jgi:hypothetical protein
MAFIVHAQELTRHLISNGGSTYKQDVSLECSLGEIILQSYDQNNSSSIGFHQSTLIVTSVDEPLIDSHNIQLKPNPTSGDLFIRSTIKNQEIVMLKIYSMNGQYVMQTTNRNDSGTLEKL